MPSRFAVLCALGALAVAGCGGDDDEGAEQAETDAPAVTQEETTAEPAPGGQEETAAEAEDCGSVEPPDAATDAPTNIRAEGVDCETAKELARMLTIEGADAPVLGFDCPDAGTFGAESQRCTKGEQVVTWEVEFR